MQVPPNMIRRSTPIAPFAFTELSLSDDEVTSLCVIPCRARSAPAPRRRSRRRGVAVAAGMASLVALQSCASLAPPAVLDATVEVVQLANALILEKRVVVSEPAPQAPRVQARTPSRPPRPTPVPSIVDSALLVRASRAMDAGQYRAALAMYQKLIRRQPAQVDALFGAALASHELNQTKGAQAYLQKTLALQPDHPLANVLAGFSDQLARRFSSAREHYHRFLSVEEAGARSDEIRAVLAVLPEGSGAGATGSR